MAVTWEPYVRPEPPEADSLAILELERQWNVTLPEEYKQLVSKHQGMAPRPYLFNIGRGKNVFSTLLTITHHERLGPYSVQREYETLRSHVPPGIYPFGTTPGGESLCFDYREGSEHPKVLLVTVEGTLYVIARDFADFLNGLHEEEER